MSQAKSDESTLARFEDHRSLSWKDHWVYQLDGQGGRIPHRARFRFLPPYEGKMVMAWGLAEMDNGEIAVAGIAEDIVTTRPQEQFQTVLAFSSDRGATWSEYHPVEECSFRPHMLTYLGNGVLTFMTLWDSLPRQDAAPEQLYSHDYGRTWPERVKLPMAPDGCSVDHEGNPLVDRDENGVAVLMAKTGSTFSKGPFPRNPCCGCIQWSRDGGRTWENFSWPEEWTWEETYQGKSFKRGTDEGGLVRAANGWIVAALRPDMPPRLIPLSKDSFMRTAVSISKDNGKTWSPLNFIFGSGRHHANLLRLPNDDLVMTIIRRHDMQDGELASYRCGCEAVVSHDNGLTWDVDHMVVLDEFSAIGLPRWYEGKCGHLYSIPLDDGMVLTTYGNYHNGGALILWKP